jgi:hypothetical protein
MLPRSPVRALMETTMSDLALELLAHLQREARDARVRARASREQTEKEEKQNAAAAQRVSES